MMLRSAGRGAGSGGLAKQTRMILGVPYWCHIMSKIINLFHFVAELRVYYFSILTFQ